MELTLLIITGIAAILGLISIPILSIALIDNARALAIETTDYGIDKEFVKGTIFNIDLLVHLLANTIGCIIFSLRIYIYFTSGQWPDIYYLLGIVPGELCLFTLGFVFGQIRMAVT